MKPSEVGFDGAIMVKAGNNNPVIRFARSMNENMGPKTWSTCWNDNMNGKMTNTFIWWGKPDPELFYRSKDGKLYTVNFEPYNEN
jgi:hypothetical protein